MQSLWEYEGRFASPKYKGDVDDGIAGIKHFKEPKGLQPLLVG